MHTNLVKCVSRMKIGDGLRNLYGVLNISCSQAVLLSVIILFALTLQLSIEDGGGLRDVYCVIMLYYKSLYFYILQLSSEDGGGLRDLLTQASMDYRISSYRLIMDSTRSILNSDSSCGSPPLDSGLEDVFEELADGLDYPRGTLSHLAYIFSGFSPCSEALRGIVMKQAVFCIKAMVSSKDTQIFL